MANFYHRFAQSVERYPDAVAVELLRQAKGGQPPPPESLTYRQMRAQVDALGRWLRAGAAPAGARCAILAQNSPRWLVAYLGAIAAGAVAVPLDTNFNAGQVEKLLKDSGGALLFVDSKHLELGKKAVGCLCVTLVLLEGAGEGAESLDRVLAAASAPFTPAEAADDDTAVIVYTSGTTSDPKGVMLTHGGLAAELEAAFRIADVGPGDATLGVLPLFHVLSQMASLLLPLSAGARTVFLEAAGSAELLRALRERRITIFVCVPQFFYLIHERIQSEVSQRSRLAQAAFRAALRVAGAGRRLGLNLGRWLFRPVHGLLGPKLRFFVTGGARMDPAVCRDFLDLGFELLQAYGLSETTGAVFCTPLSSNVPGSVGRPMHGVRVKLLDAKPSEEAGGREVGEIAIASPTLMKGYYNRADATAEVLGEGWLKTGDLGYLDEAGNLFIAGRRKEMIVLSSGKNIYPEEIEAHYLKSPYIKEMCVVGLRSAPGEPFSERLHGVVVPDFELLRERKIVNALEVIRFDLESLSAQLPATKRILSYDLWQEDLPRTTTRKIKRFEVERRVKERRAGAPGLGLTPERELAAEDRAWLEDPKVAKAVALVKEASKREGRRVHPKDNIELDLGLDSVERVELVGALERELGAAAHDWSQVQVFTVRELVDAVIARARAGGGGGASRGPAWGAVLGRPTEDPEALDITSPRQATDFLWFLAWSLARVVARVVYGLRVTGLEKLPGSGAFILSPNHQSYLDGPVLIAALPARLRPRLFYVGTSEIFGTGLMRALARTLRLIPIDPDVNMVSAMRAGAYGLSAGRVLILFPEGERSIDGQPKTFKKGAAILAAHLKVPICPVALEGFHDAWPRGGTLRASGRLRIAIGDPIPPPERVESEAAYAALTAALKERVVKLWAPLKGD